MTSRAASSQLKVRSKNYETFRKWRQRAPKWYPMKLEKSCSKISRGSWKNRPKIKQRLKEMLNKMYKIWVFCFGIFWSRPVKHYLFIPDSVERVQFKDKVQATFHNSRVLETAQYRQCHPDTALFPELFWRMRVANLNWNFRVYYSKSVSQWREMADEKTELYRESTKTAVASSPPTRPSHQIWSWTPKMLNPNLLSINFTQEPFKLNHFVHFCILFPSAEMSVYGWNAQIIQTTGRNI